jgi:hypothetical protein
MKSRRAITTVCHLFAFASSNTTRKIFARPLKSLGVTIGSPDSLRMTAYRRRPHERPGSSGQTSLVAASCQSIRFARLLGARFDTGQPHLLTRVCPLK